jgi:hypothetical protein
MDLGEVGSSDVDWIGLAKDRDMWRALVNSVLNLRGNYRVTLLLVASLVVLSSIKLLSYSANGIASGKVKCRCMVRLSEAVDTWPFPP